MRHLSYHVCCLIVLALSLFAVPSAVASILPLDGNSDALISGTETFADGVLNADIGFAVFAPGVFTGGAVGGVFGNPVLGGFDAANDFVYAYHISNSGSTPISSLQVSLASGGLFTDLGEDTAADPTGVSPTTITPVGASAAAYLFVSTLAGGLGQIEAGETSSVLLLSSPQSYQFTTASIIDSGLGATGSLPTPAPIPEPAAIWTWLGLAMLGGMVALYQLQGKRPSESPLTKQL